MTGKLKIPGSIQMAICNQPTEVFYMETAGCCLQFCTDLKASQEQTN